MNTENVPTLKIHKLTREQYERELGAGRIDPMAIYLTPNETVCSIEQGGTGANNAADALVNLGAAPAGYGLGDSVWISDGRSANDIMSNGWFSWGSGGVVDIPFPTGYMFVVARQSGKYVTQFALNANYTGTGNTQTAVRTYGTDGWSEWVNNSPSAFAPAGFGLGVQFPQSISSLADLDTLTQNGWYVISASASTLAGVYFNHAMVFVQCRYGSTYQELVPIKSTTKLRRYRYDGTWSEWEVENPPMVAGVEYRTTERVGDRPVYAYLFNYGYYSTATTVIPHNLSVYQPVSIDITNNLQEILTNSSGMKELSFNRTNINISCDWNMGNVHFIMKYTK